MISCMINFSIAGFWYRDSAEAAFASALAMKGQPVELPLQSELYDFFFEAAFVFGF